MRSRFVLAAIALPLVMVPIASGAGQSKPVDPVTQATGLKGADLRDFKRNMKEVGPYDRESAARIDITPAQARSASTPELVLDFIRSSEWVVMTLYEDPNIGLYRASLSSPSLAELLKRKDYAEGLIKAYATFDVDPRRNPNWNRDNGVLALGIMEGLITYKPMFPKFKGHEKQLLTALCDRYWAIKRANMSYPKKERPYTDNQFPIDLAYALQKQMGFKLPPGFSGEPAPVGPRPAGPLTEAVSNAGGMDELVGHFDALASK
jgi:hypothetical protein